MTLAIQDYKNILKKHDIVLWQGFDNQLISEVLIKHIYVKLYVSQSNITTLHWFFGKMKKLKLKNFAQSLDTFQTHKHKKIGIYEGLTFMLLLLV